MAVLTYTNVGISALSACVPSRVIDNYHYDLDIWPEDEVRKVRIENPVTPGEAIDEKEYQLDILVTLKPLYNQVSNKIQVLEKKMYQQKNIYNLS